MARAPPEAAKSKAPRALAARARRGKEKKSKSYSPYVGTADGDVLRPSPKDDPRIVTDEIRRKARFGRDLSWLDELGRETLLELRQALAATANRLRWVPNTDGISRTLKGWRAKWTRRGRIPPKMLARVERRRTSEKEGRAGSAA